MGTTKNKFNTFFVIAMIQTIAANFAHPATPTIIKNLGLPDYMFGVAFAGMSIANFLFAPFWGKICDQIGRKKVMMLGGVGYALGQMLFGMATTQLGILLGRMVSGMFIAAWTVGQLSYIMDNSDAEKKGKYFTILATIQSVGGAFGYLIGGYLSEFSIPLMFLAQVVLLAGTGLLSHFLLRDNPDMGFTKTVAVGPAIRSANPLSAFMRAGKDMSKTLILLSFVTLIASFAAIAYDQCFNFFIKDQMAFSPANNGLLRAVLGVIGFAANMTIGMRIMKKTNLYRSTGIILGLYGVVMGGLLVATPMAVFVIINIILFSLNALYNPAIQAAYAAGANDDKNNGSLMGIFTSVKAIGMVVGSLFAGFIYSSGPRLSFVYALVALLVASAICFRVYALNKVQIK